jgi:polysaccharide export outer membrane protein
MRSALSLVASLAFVAVAELHAQGPGTSEQVVRPGDAVRITVWRKPELSGEFAVAPDGGIRHPLYRGVNIGGLAVGTAESRVRSFLATLDEAPQFIFEPLFRVLVAGEVGKPGMLLLDQGTLIVQAVATAGGPTDRARTDRVRLLRGSTVILVDLGHPERGPAQMPIQSGDQIYVERRSALFRDVILPIVSIVGSAAAIVNVMTRGR